MVTQFDLMLPVSTQVRCAAIIARNRFGQCDARIAVGAYPRKEHPLLLREIHVSDNVFTGARATELFDYLAPDPTGGLEKSLHVSGNQFQP
jgi:hypothetical protein